MHSPAPPPASSVELIFRPGVPRPGRVSDCTGAIVRLLSSGVLDPRKRLGESSLAGKLGVSRTAIRSALEHLEAAGLVERRPRAGTYLRAISHREFGEAMEVRAALEELAAGQAAHRADRGGRKELKRLAARVDALEARRRKGEEVSAELVAGDLEFHLLLARLSGNQRLALTLQQLRLIEFTLLPRSAPEAGQSVPRIPTHKEIAEAVAAEDPRRAARKVRLHILRTKEARLGA